MERPGDAMAGHKHHVTKDFMEYLKHQTMDMCQRGSLMTAIFFLHFSVQPVTGLVQSANDLTKLLGRGKLENIIL